MYAVYKADTPTDEIDGLEIADDPFALLCAAVFLVPYSRWQTVLVWFSRRAKIQSYSIQKVFP